jgi:hypothetical protein
MNGALLSLVGIIYFIVGLNMFFNGKWALGMVWLGYAIAQIGLIIVSIKE